MSQKYYITTSIPYLNARPHVGFAMELVQADFLARYHRLAGDDVYFLTGSDEHGIKIAEKAAEEGITPQQLVDTNAAFFNDLGKKINSSHDDFVRTTEPRHQEFAQEMWKKLAATGDIYKSKYSGLYCVGCERFYSAKELVDGKCPIHLKPLKEVEEENYFFRLSKYQEEILKLIQDDTVLVVPESRKHEILNFIKDGLDDVSFSRAREAVKWGIEVPGDPSQLMYVWCDALTNYLSVIDREKLWPAEVQVLGKDILRFHAVYWIGMLLSAGYQLPKVLMVHGFITSEGQKMSKSLGNVKDPFEYIEKHGADALRYFLLREIPTLGDGDFSENRFEIVYREELGNTFGNLVSRVVAMAGKYFEGKVPVAGSDDGFVALVEQTWKKYDAAVAEYDFKKALETVVELGFAANKYVDDNKPWELAKTDTVKLAAVLYNLLEVIRHLGMMLEPVIPEAAGKIAGIFGPLTPALSRFPHPGPLPEGEGGRKFGILKEGMTLKDVGILFPRIV